MFHPAKPDEFKQLAAHPNARMVEGGSGIQYLSVPANVVDPAAVKRHCLLTGEERYANLLVIPALEDGSTFSPPYDR